MGPAQRAAWLDELDGGRVDVVVIGGGATGAGCALDLALRGHSVALLEQRDLAAGTSSRSSKLVHGGLRYLARLEFGLVRESLAERRLLLGRLAPHLVHPVQFLYPIRRGWRERLYTGLGIALYSALAGRGPHAHGSHRHLSARNTRRLAPALDADMARGGITYWDGQTDDARLVVAIARTAAAHGARILTSACVRELLVADGAVRGVIAHCAETGRCFEVHADAVVNATGVWTSQIEQLADTPASSTQPSRTRLRASKGIHLLVPRDRIDLQCGLIVAMPPSVLFVVPWGERWIIGTTDTDWDLDYAHPAASRADIDLLLERLNSVLANPLSHQDICGVYAGLRPLLAGDAPESAKLSREHTVARVAPGLVSVAGGKYTTYRVMAADAVEVALDEVTAARGDAAPRRTPRWRRRGAAARRSPTLVTPLVGAHGYEELRRRHDELGAHMGMSRATAAHLLDRHGDQVHDVLGLIAAQPDLGEPLTPELAYLRAEVVHAVRAEGALHLDDVLARRTRLSVESWNRGIDAAVDAAELMGAELGWSPETVEREVSHYRARVAAERDSQTRHDDQTADAARLGAPDVRCRTIRC
ncbi:glycerol-3-phosphate dehydrogenase/oxidase [Candidatus Poriferisodalis sp.]|uniref:glycerol-3-phosphate dehydrogenase/oxidase n=1 Tax=Candidatus Poriferisodalis sp. TaxID=3101277 RepID=UPI003B01F661